MTDNVEVTQAAFDAEVIAFLMGQGPLEGVWFHDRHPIRKGAFWWRSVLRERSAATASNTAMVGELVEALRAIEIVMDGYRSQMKFCDIEALGYFREFDRRIEQSGFRAILARAKASEVQP
jgi:hypothetical protein